MARWKKKILIIWNTEEKNLSHSSLCDSYAQPLPKSDENSASESGPCQNPDLQRPKHSSVLSMSANVFGAKKFIPTAPDKGSFPLDHEGKMLILGINNYTNYSVPSSQFLGECKEFYLKFMICLAENDNLTSACREDSKAYLGCR